MGAVLGPREPSQMCLSFSSSVLLSLKGSGYYNYYTNAGAIEESRFRRRVRKEETDPLQSLVSMLGCVKNMQA